MAAVDFNPEIMVAGYEDAKLIVWALSSPLYLRDDEDEDEAWITLFWEYLFQFLSYPWFHRTLY